MLPRRFFWKYFLGYAAMLALVAIAITALGTRAIEHSSREESARSLEMEARLLRELARPVLSEAERFPARADSLYQQLQGQILGLDQGSRSRFTIILESGRVVADSDELPSQMGDHSGRPELHDARREGWGRAERYSRTLRSRLMYLAVPVLDEASGELLGFARASDPLEARKEQLSRLRNNVLRASTVALLAALLVGYLFTRRVTRPLRNIADAVEAIRAGDYEHRILVETRDDLGELAQAFNDMEDQIQDQIQTIETDRNQIYAILQSMSDGVIAVDAGQVIRHLNDAACTALGVRREDVKGQRLWEVVRSGEVRGIVERALESGRSQSLETRINLGDHERTLELRCNALQGNQGRVGGAVLVLQDVSKLRRLEGVRRDFVSNVSHELKTPLTALRGLIESILEDEEVDRDTTQRFLRRMHHQIARLNQLISDLLNLSRLERADAPLDRQRLDLNQSARMCAQDARDAASRKNIELRTELSDEPVFVRADLESLRQIFDNLLTNAIRYTPSGGHVRLRVQRLDGSRQVVAEVEDDGIGIESRHHDRIFERFYRVDNARSRELGGTGLGLSIVKHVVSRLDGEILLESSLGRGSRFRVILPLDESGSDEPAI